MQKNKKIFSMQEQVKGSLPSMGQHGSPGHRDAKHAAVLLGGVLHIGRGVVRQSRGRVPVFRGPCQVFRDEPEELGPALELKHFTILLRINNIEIVQKNSKYKIMLFANTTVLGRPL